MLTTKISVVLPVHNEETYLPYSLNGLKDAPVDELIFVLDRCTDNSETIIRRFAKSAKYKVKIIKKLTQQWHCPTAEVFEIGFSHATGDYIFVAAGDLVYCKEMFNPQLFKKIDFIMYFYWNYDIKRRFQFRQHFLNFMKKYLTVPIRRKKARYRSGVFGCKREVWQKLHFKDVPSEYDDLYSRAIEHGYKTKFVQGLPIFHLRVGLTHDRQYLQGMSRAQRGYHPVKVFLHSLIFLKPYVWTSYWFERKYRLFEKRKWSKNGY